MISLAELNPHKYPTTPEIDINLQVLLGRINVIRAAYGIPMVVTSGLRSDAQQQRLIAAGQSKATKSKHLTGQAVDIYDPSGKLAKWVQANLILLEDTQLWCEDFRHTDGWVHFQCVSPKSGNRIFIP